MLMLPGCVEASAKRINSFGTFAAWIAAFVLDWQVVLLISFDATSRAALGRRKWHGLIYHISRAS